MDGKALLEALLALLFFSEILIAGAPQMRSLLRCFSLSQKLEEETRCLSRYRSLVLNLDSDTEFSALSSCADLLETHCASSGMKRECEVSSLWRRSLPKLVLLPLPRNEGIR